MSGFPLLYSDDDERQWRARRAWRWSGGAALVLALALLLRLPAGALVILGIPAGLVLLLTLPHALTGRVRLVGSRLSGSQPPIGQRAPRGGVDLTALVRISSIGGQYGAISGRGLAIFRPLLRIEDRAGGEAWIYGWGWSDQDTLWAELRKAVVAGPATVDRLTFRRLKFPPATAAQRR